MIIRPFDTRNVQYKIATTTQELESAFRLIYQSYLYAGMVKPHPQEIRITTHHLLRTTTVFIATLDTDVIFTVSLIGEGNLEFPIEDIYPDVVKTRHDRGLRLCEVSCLASQRLVGMLPVFVELSRFISQYAVGDNVDEFLIAVHPKHIRFYKRYFGFTQIREQVDYPLVCNKPAVALSLNFKLLKENHLLKHSILFKNPFDSSLFQSSPMTQSQVDHFAVLVGKQEGMRAD